MAKNERTSSAIASVAGQLLHGRQTAEAVEWLEQVVENPATDAESRGHAMTLLGMYTAMRRVAGSALTQR